MKMSDESTFTTRIIADKQMAIRVILLMVTIILLAITFAVVTTRSAHDQQYIRLSGELRVLSQNIVKNAAEASSARVEAFPLLKESRNRFDVILDQLQNGDDTLKLPPADHTEVVDKLQNLAARWTKVRNNADTIFESEGTIRQLSEFVKHINHTIPNLLALSDEVVETMIEIGSNAQQIYIGSRQLMLSQRMSFNVNTILQGGQNAATAADRFGRDASLFGRVLEAMLKGNPNMNIKRIRDPDARDKLREVAGSFAEVSELVGRILEKTPELFQAQYASENMFLDSEELLTDTTKLMQAFSTLGEHRVLSAPLGYAFGLLSVLALIWLGMKLVGDARQRLQETEQRNRANQEAIMRLLEEIGDLADGDLTIHATVTESFTGAIADAINFSIDALRQLVTTINETTVQVSSAAQETQATAMHLAEASDHQAQQITSVGAAVNEMAASIEQVSKNAASSTEVAQGSVRIANKGSLAVQDTIKGMDSIRQTMQETSKRIKRLGESSQEIGDIVELINDIADQTNVLALNAAIQAAMAGEAGRGFAVVADEVQRLAERSSNATKQIEGLVRTIQADTKEAVASMEQSTTDVVQGAKLAQNAGSALTEIEGVSGRLAVIIQNINDASQQQARAAGSISDTMNIIQEVTTQTSAGTNETATSIGNLAELSNDLRKSVAGFKLPA